MTDCISSGHRTETDRYSEGTCAYIISKHPRSVLALSCELLAPTHRCLSVYTGASVNHFVYTTGTFGSVKGQYAITYYSTGVSYSSDWEDGWILIKSILRRLFSKHFWNSKERNWTWRKFRIKIKKDAWDLETAYFLEDIVYASVEGLWEKRFEYGEIANWTGTKNGEFAWETSR